MGMNTCIRNYISLALGAWIGIAVFWGRPCFAQERAIDISGDPDWIARASHGFLSHTPVSLDFLDQATLLISFDRGAACDPDEATNLYTSLRVDIPSGHISARHHESAGPGTARAFVSSEGSPLLAVRTDVRQLALDPLEPATPQNVAKQKQTGSDHPCSSRLFDWSIAPDRKQIVVQDVRFRPPENAFEGFDTRTLLRTGKWVGSGSIGFSAGSGYILKHSGRRAWVLWDGHTERPFCSPCDHAVFLTGSSVLAITDNQLVASTVSGAPLWSRRIAGISDNIAVNQQGARVAILSSGGNGFLRPLAQHLEVFDSKGGKVLAKVTVPVPRSLGEGQSLETALTMSPDGDRVAVFIDGKVYVYPSSH